MLEQLRTLMPAHTIVTAKRESYLEQVRRQIRFRLFALKLAEEGKELIRPLLPHDLGRTSWAIRNIESGVMTAWIDFRTRPNQVIALYGLTQVSSTPAIDRIRISRRPSYIYDLDLNFLYGILPIITKLKQIESEYPGWVESYYGGLEYLKMEGFLAEPMLIDPENYCQIEVMADRHIVGPKKELVINGYVAEPCGETLA